MNNWKLVKLEEIATFQEGYVNPPQTNNEYFDGDVKWLRAVDLNDSEVWNTSRTLSDVGFESAGKSALMFKPNTIAISKSGTIGRLGILKDYMCGNRAIINIEVNGEKADLMYVFYSLIMARREIIQYAVGSVQANLYPSVLGKFEIPLPSISTQKKVASVISKFDDLIVKNQNTSSRNIEIIAALFRSWFIDFDPVKAKAEGKLPYGMNEQTVALFSDSLEDTELGPTPSGWRIQRMAEVADVSLGGTPSRDCDNFWGEDGIPWINSGETRNLPIIEPSEYITEAGFDNSSTKLIPARTTVIAITGATLGQISFTSIECCTNQSIVAVVGNDLVPPEFIFPLFKIYSGHLKMLQTGGAQPHINRTDVGSFQFVLPPEDIMKEYISKVSQIYDLLDLISVKIVALKSLRDSLLPRLMSGELTIS